VALEIKERSVMGAFRILLGCIFLTIFDYTAVVIANHGMGLLPVFFGDMAKMAWPGQFNLDFAGFLILSGLWLAWRHQFSPAGIALGVLGLFGGAPVLAAYLFFASRQADGDWARLFLGEERARTRA
jgi:hypothetical protein